jgi:hypothetical protein
LADYLDILRHEFYGEEGSFLRTLRERDVWDRDAFLRVTSAMESYCRDHANEDFEERVEHWIASGFWFIADFVRVYTNSEKSQELIPGVDYRQSNDRLYELSYWFFTRDKLYQETKSRC